MGRHLLDLLELEHVVALDGASYQSLGYLQALVKFYLSLNVTERSDELVLAHQLLQLLRDDVCCRLLQLGFVILLPQVVGISLCVLEKRLQRFSPNVVSGADVLVIILLDCGIAKDFQLLLYG